MKKIISLTLLSLSILSFSSVQNPEGCSKIESIIINSFGGYVALYDYSESLAASLDGRFDVTLNNGQGVLIDALRTQLYDQTTDVIIKAEFKTGQCSEQVQEIKDSISNLKFKKSLQHKVEMSEVNGHSGYSDYSKTVIINLNQEYALKKN